VSHVGTGHRWAATVIEQRLDQPPPLDIIDAPEDPGDWPTWLASGAQRLIDAVEERGADRPVWTWQADKSAGFWLRRMLHDEVVHRYDADLALGTARPDDPIPDLPTDVAVDGVSDFLTTCATLSRPNSFSASFPRLAGDGETLHLRATDTDAVWLAQRTPVGVTWSPEAGAAGVTVSGPVRELVLLLNRRLDPDAPGIEITGDADQFAYWWENSRF
jgi:hypothetical protein